MTPPRALLLCLAAARAFSPHSSARPLGRAVLRSAPTEAPAETKMDFSADVSRVMEIIINSLYSDKDVFLRELVSNAADACDKKRFLELTSGASTDALRVRVKADKAAGTLTIEDSGVGMSRDELINNLGKIAMSGTKKFAEALGKGGADDVNLIGQFGVGFYSGFLVADEMTVESKALATGEEHRWSSDAKTGYTMAASDGSNPIPTKSGTRITLKLKDDALEYLEEFKLRELLKRYSEFVSFPIELFAEKTTYEDVPDEAGNSTKSVPVKANVYDVVNPMQPVWLRKPKDVNASEYAAFYKAAFRAYDEPLKYVHFALEGQVQFKAVLFVPSVLPFELTRNMFDESGKSIKLYVKRVFINDNFELVPRWLTFVKGVVDSEDLPLNVGREILQKSKMLSIISKRLVRKSIDMFKDIAKDEVAFDGFTKNYGKYLKVGLVEETGDAQKDLAKLVKYWSTIDDKQSSLSQYVAKLPANSTRILYVSGDSKAAAAQSPVLERLKKNGYPVLLLTEPLDELSCQAIGEFEGMQLVDAAKADLEGLFDDDEEEQDPAEAADFEKLLEFLTETLGKKVSKVSLSKRLTESPAALVQGAYGMSAMMNRYMAAQATSTGQDMDGFGMSAPALEINAKHPIIVKLLAADLASDEAKATTSLLYDVAALTGGYDLDDSAAFGKRIVELMAK
ncbi:Hsp90 protein-domain-containing protein [Pelagophyceae sp. CCMP2097]|nr:Hsp90 protein-domain-containing protein [Pelagophyceae sp. CCMP2097]